MHLIIYAQPQDSSFRNQRAVLRRYTRARLSVDPSGPAREIGILQALDRARALTPPVLWSNLDGSLFGEPAFVIAHIPGRPVLSPVRRDRWLQQLASGLASIHSTPVDLSGIPAPIDQYQFVSNNLANASRNLTTFRPPWTRPLLPALRQTWNAHVMPPASLVHGDYWAGNTLWSRGSLKAIVDWEQWKLGDPDWDVACCRFDLSLTQGLDAADQFVDHYQQEAGRTVTGLRFWDLYAVYCALPDPAAWLPGFIDLGRVDLTPEILRQRTRAFAARALARAESDFGGPPL
ncbi:MAG: phosphotransferase [Chloroflexota bacterium]